MAIGQTERESKIVNSSGECRKVNDGWSNLAFMNHQISSTELIMPHEAINRLQWCLNQLRKRLDENRQFVNFGAEIYYMALIAQKKTLADLNDEHFYCKIFWDTETCLPRHPSLVADAVKSTELFDFPEDIKIFLNSLSKWMLLRKERILCCCGKKERIVSIDVMINTILKVADRSLIAKFLVGVRTDDHNHLDRHYNFKKQSLVDGDMCIILECENRITFWPKNTAPTIELVNLSCAEQYNVPEMERCLRKSVEYLAES